VDIEPLVLAVPHAPGLTHFEGTTFDSRLEGAVRVYPHHLDSGGLFMAKLRRLDGPSPLAPTSDAWRPVPAAFPRIESQDGRTESEAARVIADSVEAIRARHAIDPEFLRSCRWILRGDTVWTHRLREWPLEAWERGDWRAVSVGLRAIEIDTSGRARATNDLLRFASASVGASVVDLDADRMGRLLGGEPAPAEAASPLGPVALRYLGDVVGRGRYGREGLTSEIPKARAKDLLRALTPDSRSAPIEGLGG
jgi:hypothetical protein